MENTVTINGVIEEIIYSNPDNGYTVCDVDSTEEGLFTATGCMPFLTEGERVALTGDWVTHPDYGEQFKVEYYETVMPSDKESMIKYLGSGIISGIREATAKKIVAQFGEDTFDIMLSEPERLAEIRGISREKAEKIGEEFAKRQSVQNIMLFLQQYSISAGMAMKISNTLGSGAVNRIKENPYILSDMVDGISFNTADTIAFNLGIARNDPLRVKAGIIHILRTAAFTSGHVYMPKTVLTEDCAYKLKVDEDDVQSAIIELNVLHRIVTDTVGGDTVCYLKEYYGEETYIASRLRKMAKEKQSFTMTADAAAAAIDALEGKTGLSLAPMQREAVITALSVGCMVLTGGPGTGKTTTINTIIRLLEELKLSIALAAPTGRAAKRMTQVTGCEAKTIHRLLGAQRGKDGASCFTHNESNPLKEDVIIVDEVSMIDLSLMASFLRAVKTGARVIFSGDADQLPSVGPGNVIHDMIESGVIPTVQLNKIFRQAEKSLIIVNAHRINRGEMPELGARQSDFFFLRRHDAQSSADTIAELYKTRLPRSYGVDPLTSIQVITPSRKGLVGTNALNKLLQSSVNPYDELRPQHKYGDTVFRVGDKVMQTRNNYDMPYVRAEKESGSGIFNGDMGIIEKISESGKYITIIFDEDKRVEYPFANLDELDLAYAVTVHKSQGNEFPIVIMPVCSFAPMLCSRNLLYTAVTRAVDMVILVGSEKTVRNMVYNSLSQQRYTALSERLSAE